jgi:hypothetical protein
MAPYIKDKSRIEVTVHSSEFRILWRSWERAWVAIRGRLTRGTSTVNILDL